MIKAILDIEGMFSVFEHLLHPAPAAARKTLFNVCVGRGKH
jgi:hypothetical protein